MIVDIDMPDSASVVDLVLELKEEHRDQNFLLLDLASKHGKSGSRASSEEHCSPTLTKQGIVPTEAEAQADAEDVADNKGAEVLDREAGAEALLDPQALQEVVEDILSEPHNASARKQVASPRKPVAPESWKTTTVDAPDPHYFAGAVEESTPVSIAELLAASPQNPSPRK